MGFTVRWYAVLLLVYLNLDFVKTCPTPCSCNNDDVDCSAVGLTEIPGDLPSTATSVDLSFNSITAVNGSAFSHVTGLQSLNLTKNLISEIEDGSFGSLKSVQVLKLANNSLNIITELTFDGLENLLALDLSFNPGLTINEGALQVSTSLESLQMNGCGHSLGRYDFSNLRSLIKLELRHCELHNLFLENFKYLESLESLDLSDNQFHNFPSEVITELRQLKVLNLKNNDVDVNVGKLLTAPSLITDLNLDSNSINSIHEETLHDMRQLQNLTLTNNGLRTLPDGLFTGIPAVGKLSLALSGNRLNCDCHLRWMTTWIYENEIDDVRCTEPEPNMSLELKSLEPQALACPPYEVSGKHIYRVLAGEDVIMGCPIFIDDYTTVQWSYDCGEIVPIPSTFPFQYPYSINSDHSLVIDSVTTDLCDTYVCEADTTVGSLSTELTLEVLAATSGQNNGVVIALSVGISVFAILVIVALVMLGLRQHRGRNEDRPTTGPYSNLTESLTEVTTD